MHVNRALSTCIKGASCSPWVSCLCLRFVLQQILGQAVQVLLLLSLQAGSTRRSTELSLLCLAD